VALAVCLAVEEDLSELWVAAGGCHAEATAVASAARAVGGHFEFTDAVGERGAATAGLGLLPVDLVLPVLVGETA
jgi:hypothetical protein